MAVPGDHRACLDHAGGSDGDVRHGSRCLIEVGEQGCALGLADYNDFAAALGVGLVMVNVSLRRAERQSATGVEVEVPRAPLRAAPASLCDPPGHLDCAGRMIRMMECPSTSSRGKYTKCVA